MEQVLTGFQKFAKHRLRFSGLENKSRVIDFNYCLYSNKNINLLLYSKLKSPDIDFVTRFLSNPSSLMLKLPFQGCIHTPYKFLELGLVVDFLYWHICVLAPCDSYSWIEIVLFRSCSADISFCLV